MTSVSNDRSGSAKLYPPAETSEIKPKSKMAADVQVQLYLRAKAKRKQGAVFTASTEMISSPTSRPNLFRRLLPAIPPPKPKANLPKEDALKISNSLDKLVLFNQFDQNTKHQLASSFTLHTFPSGHILFNLGDYGEDFYIISTGKVRLFSSSVKPQKKQGRPKSTKKSLIKQRLQNLVSGRFHRAVSDSTTSFTDIEQDAEPFDEEALPKGEHMLSDGDCFGELGMHYGSPRERSAVCVTETQIWTLDRATFSSIVQNEFHRKNELVLDALGKIQLLENIHPKQLTELENYVELITFPKDTLIIEKGSLAGTFYMIVAGEVDCIVHSEEGEKIFTYKEGSYFGERGLLQKDGVRKADVVAKTEVELLAITYKSLSKHLGGLFSVFEENMKLQALQEAAFFPEPYNPLLKERLKILNFKDEEAIVKQDTDNEYFYIIRQGSVKVKSKIGNTTVDITMLSENDYFGEGTILTEKKANATVIANGEVNVYALDRDTFKQFLLPEKILFIKDNHQQRLMMTSKKQRTQTTTELNNTPLKRMKVLRNLGSGCFGLVRLVHHPDLKSYFALKMLEKGMVVKNHQEINVLNEKNILMEVDHPFIVKLYRTYKDPKYLYFLMEFIQGGEMFQFLHNERGGHLDSATARFYIAGVVDALDYLHKKRIVYRDLKPENLMIDKTGYVKVVDFGFAKRLLYRTFTLCGTAQYLAPEILYNHGYGKSIDLWTLGILIYELFTGTTPFKRKTRNELFQAIKHENRIRFSSKRWKDGEEAKDLVCLLLHKHPKRRFGCGAKGFKDVREHAWFKGIDFIKLCNKELPPPWLPTIKSMEDVSHFEEYDESDNPIQGKYDDKAGLSEIWEKF